MAQELGTVQQVIVLVTNFLVAYAFQIAGAIIILIAGFVVANWVSRALLRIQERRHVDVTLRQFIASTARVLVIGLFVIMALGKLGISITPLIAALGGLAVGASFAIQGPVSNYGAGMVVILTRMFKIGDTINVQDCSGWWLTSACRRRAWWPKTARTSSSPINTSSARCCATPTTSVWSRAASASTRRPTLRRPARQSRRWCANTRAISRRRRR
ncbi:MAG: mechanosensitive ion channel [Proteobacteria bacterium]|nr:mechanosensitive ion channel [Pseudomonadota bacterium]